MWCGKSRLYLYVNNRKNEEYKTGLPCGLSDAELIKASKFEFRLAHWEALHFGSTLIFGCPLTHCTARPSSGGAGLNAHLGTSKRHVPRRMRSHAACPHRCARTECDFGHPNTTEWQTSGTLQSIPAVSVAHNMHRWPLINPSQHTFLALSDASDENGWTQSRRCAGRTFQRVRTALWQASLLSKYKMDLSMAVRGVFMSSIRGRMLRTSRTGLLMFLGHGWERGGLASHIRRQGPRMADNQTQVTAR